MALDLTAAKEVEVAVLHKISHARANSTELEAAIATMAAIVLPVIDGVALAVSVDGPEGGRLVVHLAGSEGAETEPVEALEALSGKYQGLFSAAVTSEGQRFGEVRLYSRSTRFDVACPLDLARFLGQQIGAIAATRAYAEAAWQSEREAGRIGREQSRRLEEINAQLRERLRQLREELETRKSFDRAAGLVATHRKISTAEAGRWIEDLSRRTGRALQAVTEDLISAHARILPAHSLRRRTA